MSHVLVVEDHEENRNLLKMLLEANAYKVTVAGDGVEALVAARRDPPDVIVSDVLMPNMDGFALCREWMKDEVLKSIPFIFYSATYVRVEDEQFALAEGAVRYLIKPLEAEAFLRELRATLEQWAGHAAPTPAKPLDDLTANALHKSALARKVEDKIAQLEATNRMLQESEARFRSLAEMSSDFYWESDAGRRLTLRTSPGGKLKAVLPPDPGVAARERRREVPPYLSPEGPGWDAHRAVLDAHQPFREFELSRRDTDGTTRFFSISGDPVFDTSGEFRGYRGVGTDITDKKRTAEQIEYHLVQIQIALMSTVKVVTALGEMRDPYTAGHQRRVAEIAVAIGSELGMDERQLEGLRVAGFLHDIGKIRVPSEILSKPGKLSPAEFQLVQVHPQASYDVLKDVEFPWPIADIALQHHERMDGSGYPRGLKGDAIRMEARIIAVADVIEAMSLHRPYRDGLGIERALAEIERGRGSVYDSAVADACIRLFREKHFQLSE
jgi:response regulator RpfG family c-di-GMP phosphodiesterase